jgi:O-antigen ligase
VKWIALALLLLAVPALAAWLRTNPKAAPLVWGLLGFLPFVLGPWHLMVSPYATPIWSGYVKGWEISLLDTVALGIIFGTRGRWPRLTLVVPFVIYILAVTFAVSQAKFAALALSYPIQLCRVFLVFIAVTRVAVNERGERAVFTGLVLGLAVQACYAVTAKAGGALQTGGSLGHQNLLGFVSHLAVMPAFAMFLAGRFPRTAFAGVIAGILDVILTASRATIALSVFGLVLTLLLSISLRFSRRKAALALIGVLVLLVTYPLANIVLEQRLEAQNQSFFAEDKEREAFERAARAMIRAEPMGVGPNHYVFIANTEGYSARAGVAWRSQSRSTSVHNSYLLVTAETGFLGLISFVTLIVCAAWFAFRTAFQYRDEQASELLIGVGCGIVAMSLHGLLEWMFVVYPTQYVLAVGFGFIGGLRARFMAAAPKGKAAKRGWGTRAIKPRKGPRAMAGTGIEDGLADLDPAQVHRRPAI